MKTQKKITPMMRQYLNLKRQYKNKILLFRMGDFYETFDNDAKITSKILNITLTSRDRKSNPTPLAGFPHHALDQYLPELVRAGYNVAVADQVEDPKIAKGIVRREVIRIVTPGTLTDEKTATEKRSHYLGSIFEYKKTLGLALCDMATGEFKITEFNSKNKLKEELGRCSPHEILLCPKQDFSDMSEYSLQPLEEFDYGYGTANNILSKHFNTKSLSALGIKQKIAAVIAAAAILVYLKLTQKSNLSHIQKIKCYDPKGNMILDQATIVNLDLVSCNGEFGHKSTLLHVLDKTVTRMGARMLYEWLLHPLLNVKLIKNRLQVVNELVSNNDLLENVQKDLKNISDLERICGKIGLNRVNARDLTSLSESLTKAISISELLKNSESLKTYSDIINSSRDILEKVISIINTGIIENPPMSIYEGNIINNGFNSEIDEIRKCTQTSKEWIKTLEVSERKRTDIPSLKVKFNKVFGYYIEITNTHKDKVPDNYIRKQTLVNCERYITPELKEKEEIVLNAEEKLAQLELECFQLIIDKITPFIPTIQSIAHTISKIDVLSSFACSARLNRYICPNIYDFGKKEDIIAFTDGRHPIVETLLDDEFVTNDLHIDSDKNRLNILTGPNMSGKSTYIRQAALIILMAQIGSFVPASSADISIVDRIFTRVGASDDISAGRSTFLVEMDEAANIIHNATKHSFIVLDEIGRGTSTYDGVSIAWAIAEHINCVIQSRCIFATHYHELIKLESDLDGIKNLNVAVLEDQDNIIFLRKIEQGGTDKSYGIHVAKMAGLPEVLINRARKILSGFEQEDMFGVRSNKISSGEKPDKTKVIQDNNTDNPHQFSFID